MEWYSKTGNYYCLALVIWWFNVTLLKCIQAGTNASVVTRKCSRQIAANGSIQMPQTYGSSHFRLQWLHYLVLFFCTNWRLRNTSLLTLGKTNNLQSNPLLWKRLACEFQWTNRSSVVNLAMKT
jgi:ABC-type uncharacterized transport system, permease component